MAASTKHEVHQADALFLSHGTVGEKIYKYAWTVVDVVSRNKEAEALTSKDRNNIAKAFEKIYSTHLK